MDGYFGSPSSDERLLCFCERRPQNQSVVNEGDSLSGESRKIHVKDAVAQNHLLRWRNANSQEYVV